MPNIRTGQLTDIPKLPKRGPLGDVIPESPEHKKIKGWQPQEPVENRPNIGTTEPERYPDGARMDSTVRRC